MKNLLLIVALFVVGCAEDKYEEFYKAVEGTQKGQESVWLEVDAIGGTDKTRCEHYSYDRWISS